MARVKFYLRNGKANNTNIYLRLSYGAFEIVNNKKRYLPLQYYITESINPIFWNIKQGRAKRDKRFPQYSEFNTRLDSIEDIVLNVLRRLQNDRIVLTDEILRKELDHILKDGDKTDKVNLVELMGFIDFFIETSNRSVGTKKSYTRVKKDLEEFQRENNLVLTYEKVDIDFHARFIYYLKSKNYAPNTIGTRIKVLKTFMSEAYERNLHNNTDFKKKAFNKPSEDTRSVYLNSKELSIIYNLDLTHNKSLDSVRDWFLIGAYTGLRFSDLSRLTKDNIKDNVLEIRTKKTETIVAVPIHPIVRKILEKHSYELPRIISNQKFNDYIKDVVKLADINELILVEETKGDLKMKENQPKYNLITAHTARRSFATNAYIAGVPTIQIMKMTGHKTEKAFLGYIKISEKENAQKLQLHPFFNSMVVNK